MTTSSKYLQGRGGGMYASRPITLCHKKDRDDDNDDADNDGDIDFVFVVVYVLLEDTVSVVVVP
jgi:hypothetical protein